MVQLHTRTHGSQALFLLLPSFFPAAYRWLALVFGFLVFLFFWFGFFPFVSFCLLCFVLFCFVFFVPLRLIPERKEDARYLLVCTYLVTTNVYLCVYTTYSTYGLR